MTKKPNYFDTNEETIAFRAELEAIRKQIRLALDELGIPQSDYPAPISNSVKILTLAVAIPGPDKTND